jgi:hypothetical protein
MLGIDSAQYMSVVFLSLSLLCFVFDITMNLREWDMEGRVPHRGLVAPRFWDTARHG